MQPGDQGSAGGVDGVRRRGAVPAGTTAAMRSPSTTTSTRTPSTSASRTTRPLAHDRHRIASSTALVSRPSGAARPATGRARGAADLAVPRHRRPGVPSARRTRARAASSSHRPPARRRSTTATAASSPVAGSATASAQNTGPRRSRATTPPATAASSPKPVRTSWGGRRPWAVIDSHTRGPPPAIRATASMPSWARARGRVDSITTSAVATSAPEGLDARPFAEIDQHRRLAGVDEVEERRRPVAGAVDASGRLDLDDVHAGLGEQLPAQRPGPQRRQVDHPEAAQRRHGCRPAPELGGDHGGVVAATFAERADGQAELAGALDERRQPTVPDRGRHGGPPQPAAVDADPCREQIEVARSRQRHGQPPVGGAQQAGRPAAADRAATGEAGDRRPLTEQGRSVEVDGPAGARRQRAQALRRGLHHVDDS